MASDRPRPPRSADDPDALEAARSLRTAAVMRDGARRADAIWDGLALLRGMSRGTTQIADDLEDDGRGQVTVPEERRLLAAARDVERLASTTLGVDRRRTDPGRVRTHALRADSPTTTKRRRRRPRRRSR